MKAFRTKELHSVSGLPFLVIALLVFASCGGLKMGVGYWGEMLDDNMMTLDGDTFVVQGQIGEDMLIVTGYGDGDGAKPHYLLKRKHNGRYYPQLSASEMHAIDNTTDYICIDGRDVYDVKDKKVRFTFPCESYGLNYIGKWKEKLLFANQDTICFSDGKCVGLRESVYYYLQPKANGMLTLVNGAQKINAPFADLYHAAETSTLKAKPSQERLKRDYRMKSKAEYGDVRAGFSVDLDVPKGSSKADNAIRRWMMGTIVNEAFSLLEFSFDHESVADETLDHLTSSLDKYGTLWGKLYRSKYQVGDTLDVPLTCGIRMDKVADCDDYVTYRYSANLYSGGLHDLPRSYYITYDKRQGVFVHVGNVIKPAQMQSFRKMVLKSLKSEYDLWRGEDSTWDEFTNSIFSFHTPVIETSEMSDVIRAMVEHPYTCDEWAGWTDDTEDDFTEQNFPLTHLAVLPDGIVLTYHPYQIDCFAAGEYHAVVPFKDAAPCLRQDYFQHEEMKPKLGWFLK